MTQRMRAEKILARFQMPTSEHLKELTNIVAEAHLNPPDGGSDGSITPDAWMALHIAVGALVLAEDTLRQFKSSLS